MTIDFEYAVGIDIASATLMALVLRVSDESGIGAPREFANSSAGFGELEQWLVDSGVACENALLVMEATGVYWEACALALHEKQWRVQVVNPAQIKRYAQSTLRRAKTDAADAHTIARFACNVRLKAWNPPDLDLEELQLMMRQRDELVSMKTQETNRLHALERRPRPPKTVLKITRELIAFLEKRIARLEDEFKKTLKDHPQWEKMMEIMMSIPGMGLITAAAFLTETGAFASFMEARQLTAYAGIAPAPHESGSSVRGRASISKIGNSRLRRAAYQAAVSASWCNPRFKPWYQHLLGKGKSVKVARVAVARKLLELAFAMVNSGQNFDPNYAQT